MEKRHMKWIVWICSIAVFLSVVLCVFVIGFMMGDRNRGDEVKENYSVYYQVTADTLLYQEASEGANIVKPAKEGTIVTFLGVGENGFYMVQQDAEYGYIKKQFLKAADTPLEEEEANATEVPAPIIVQYEMYVTNCEKSISLRARPSMQAKVLRQVTKGEKVGYVSAAQNGFVRVVYRGMNGYVLGSYLSYRNHPSDVVIKKTMYVVNCKTDISLRSEPSASAGVMLTVPLYDPVGYIEDAGNGFAKISYRGIIGYAAVDYLTDALIPVDETPEKFLYVVNCKESITLRNAPAQSASELTQIPFGEAVGYIGDAYNGFSKIKYSGKTGYALSSYLAEKPQEKIETAQINGQEETDRVQGSFDGSANEVVYGEVLIVVKCKESITLRDRPDSSGEEISAIPLGAEVEFIEDAGNGFYQVEYLGDIGYAMAEYLTPQRDE